jgi:hypothetical protein
VQRARSRLKGLSDPLGGGARLLHDRVEATCSHHLDQLPVLREQMWDLPGERQYSLALCLIAWGGDEFFKITGVEIKEAINC